MGTKAWVAFGVVLRTGEVEAALRARDLGGPVPGPDPVEQLNAELADVGAVLLRSGDRRAGEVTWVLAARDTVTEVLPGLPAQLTLADVEKLTEPHPHALFLSAARALGLQSVRPGQIVRAAVLVGVWEP